MSAFRWFEVFLLVSNVAWTDLTNEGLAVPPSCDLNQAEAETILNFQSNLRRDLIASLMDVREKTQPEEYRSVIEEIIQGLRARTLDPFTSFRNGADIQGPSNASRLAEMIHNLQGRWATSLSEWNSLLKTIPDIILPRPSIPLMPEYLQKIHKVGGPFVVFVLTGIQENSLKPSKKLLGDILYNYRFKDYSSEMEIILDNSRQMLEESVLNFSDFRTDPSSSERPDDILSTVLEHVSRQSDQRFAYQISHLLSALSKQPNTIRVKEVNELWRLFDLMLLDDYPPDVIETKNALSSQLRRNRLGIDLSEISERLAGYPPREKLLMLVSKLTSLPSGHPLSWKAQAVYPHVKLRHLWAEGRFFRPRRASDVGFLFDSFLSAPNEMNPTLIQEIRRIFYQKDFEWEEILKGFDYSRYSKPRPLVLNMAQGLLSNSKKLPVCFVIVLSYFLRNNRQVSSQVSTPNVFTVKRTSTISTTPFAVSPDIEEVTWSKGGLISTPPEQSVVSVPSLTTAQPFTPIILTSSAPSPNSFSIVAAYKLSPLSSVTTEPLTSPHQESSASLLNSTETTFPVEQPTVSFYLPDAVTTEQSFPSAISTLEFFSSSPTTANDSPASIVSSPLLPVSCRPSESSKDSEFISDSADSPAETTSPRIRSQMQQTEPPGQTTEPSSSHDDLSF